MFEDKISKMNEGITEHPSMSAITKKSMSVPEMRYMLGLGKTASYWLVKKKYFKTIVVAGKIRVMLDSFEEWYQSQTHYKKVDVHKEVKNV